MTLSATTAERPLVLAVVRDPRAIFRWLFFALFPSLGVICLGIPLFTSLNGVDDFIYVGAVERLGDFLFRWPDTYYAARFGYIFPEYLSERLLGADIGYTALRLGLLGLVSILVAAKARTSIVPSLVAASVIVFNPVILRATFTTYTTSMAMLFLMVGMILILWDPEIPWQSVALTSVGAVFVTLAWNSHFVALPLCVIACGVPVLDGVITRGRRKRAVITAAVIGVTSLVVIGTATLVYRQRFGVTDLYGPTLSQAAASTNAIFLEQNGAWFTWRHYLLVLPLSAAFTGAVWLTETDTRERRMLRRSFWIAVLSMLAFAWLQWFKNTPLLSLFFYSSIPTGMSLSVFALACVRLLHRTRHANSPIRSSQLTALALPVASLLIAWAAISHKPRYVIVCLISISAVAGAILLVMKRLFVIPAVVCAGSMLFWLSVSSPRDFPASNPGFRVDPAYDAEFFRFDQSGMDLLRVSRNFARLLPALPEQRGEIRIWFDNVGSMNQVVSTMVSYRSALQMPLDGPMPEVRGIVKPRIAADRPRFIVLLDSDPQDVRVGERRVKELGPYVSRWVKTLRSGQATATVELLERAPGTWADFPCSGPGGSAVLC